MSSYQEDRKWADQWLPHIQALVGPYLLAPSTFEQDAKQAADLVVLRGRDMTIACRVRHPGYAERYPHEFTIRCERDSGASTELEKIVNGWGDWMFYGHAAGTKIHPWLLVDLHAWRAHMIRHKDKIKRGKKANGDGTHFMWFDIRSFPCGPPNDPILIAQSTDLVMSSPLQHPQPTRIMDLLEYEEWSRNQ